jgi:hypothetical protein
MNPILRLLFGPELGMMMGDGRPDNSITDMKALTEAYRKAKEAKRGMPPVQGLDLVPGAPKPQAASPFGPNTTHADMFGRPWMPPKAPTSPPPSAPDFESMQWPQGPVGAPVSQPTQPMPPVQGLDLPGAPHVPMPMARPQMPVAPQAQAAVPMPAPRPASAPSGGMGFFQRNAAMMRDPSSGDFIDPGAAAQANVSGPDLIQKFMNYLHKDSA